MIKIVEGCLIHRLEYRDFDAYAQQCNCFNRMGRGIAPMIAAVRPDARKVDNGTKRGSVDKLGTFSVTEKKPLVFNLYGQYHWKQHQVEPGRNTDYPSLKRSLIGMRDYLLEHHPKDDYPISIAMPYRIGCGLAGGNWGTVVYPMLKTIFDEDKRFDVFILQREEDKE